MRFRSKIVFSFAVVLTIITVGSAQRRAAPATRAGSGVAIALQVGTQTYHFEGNADCKYEPSASIYNVRAELWSVEQSDGGRSIMLTLWRPKNKSGDMLSLNVLSGGKSYVVDTVKEGPQSKIRGSGKVHVTTSGAGGTFAIDATAENGAAITGTIRCSGFTGVVAEGG